MGWMHLPAGLRTPRPFSLLLISTVLLAALACACGSGNGSESSSPSGGSQAGPIGTSIATLPPQTEAGGKGQPVDGIQCTPEHVEYHIHAHLTLLVDGVNVLIPAGIGITPPRQTEQGFVVGGSCFYWLHTHDVSGIIHVESPSSQLYTLGQFFDIWGEPLSATQVATFPVSPDKPLRVFVNGKAYTDSPDKIELTAHELITLEIGKEVAPPSFAFPPGQ
jgi:hypothetical protein